MLLLVMDWTSPCQELVRSAFVFQLSSQALKRRSEDIVLALFGQLVGTCVVHHCMVLSSTAMPFLPGRFIENSTSVLQT